MGNRISVTSDHQKQINDDFFHSQNCFCVKAFVSLQTAEQTRSVSTHLSQQTLVISYKIRTYQDLHRVLIQTYIQLLEDHKNRHIHIHKHTLYHVLKRGHIRKHMILVHIHVYEKLLMYMITPIYIRIHMQTRAYIHTYAHLHTNV